MKSAAIAFALIGISLLIWVPVAQADNLIFNVPDWNQPDAYNIDGQNGYTGWCAPTSGASIMGYWEDVKNCTGLADGHSNLGVNPPTNTPVYPWTASAGAWQQGLWHDGVIEMGWLMNTSGWRTMNPPMIPPLPILPPGNGLWPGTQSAAIGPGLLMFATGSWTDQATLIQKTAFPNAKLYEQTSAQITQPPATLTWSQMWDTYVTEINFGHPVEVAFSNWVQGAGTTLTHINGQEVKTYSWDPAPAEGGHAVVGVGYVDPNPNILNGDEYFVCQDNWQSTCRYVAVPLEAGANSMWNQNDYIWPVSIPATWVGGFNSTWGFSGNWIGDPAILPPNAAGRSVLFGNQPSKNNSVNVDGSHTVGQITFTPGTGTTLQSSVNGTILTLDNGANSSTIADAGSHAVTSANLTVALNSNVNIDVAGSGDTLTIGSIVSDGSNGAKGITKQGSGLLTLSGLNTYTGVTKISGGTIDVNKLANGGLPSSIGAAGNDPANLVLDGGTLHYAGTTANGTTGHGFTVTEKGGIMKSTGTGGAKGFVWSGNVASTGTGNRTLTVYIESNTGSRMSGAISDDGTNKLSITKDGTGRLKFDGAMSKAYSGDTTILAGDLWLEKTSMLPFGQDKGDVIINSGSALNLDRYSTNINGLYDGPGGGGTVSLNYSGSVTLMLGCDEADGDFSGSLIDANATYRNLSLSKSGTGTQILRGNNNYTGDTSIYGGVLELTDTGRLDTNNDVYITDAAASFKVLGAHTLDNISGAGILDLGDDTSAADLTVKTLDIGTLTIGAGSKLTIAVNPAGPLTGLTNISPVPESSAWAMLILAAMGLGIFRRRRR
jgi:autotransporter-associated beta strand protein